MSISSAPSATARAVRSMTSSAGSSPRGKFTTVAMRTSGASSRRAWTTKAGQMQIAATDPCAVTARRHR